jgi:DNA repair photolyase
MINKPIYVPSGRAKEYGDYAINIYGGCNHGCTYCYAPAVLHKTREKFGTNVEPRRDIVESVKRQLVRERITDKLIHLCFACDPYPADIDTTATREVIRAIKDTGNHVQILTKGGVRAERDFDLLDGGDRFGVTIACDDEMQRTTEPNAAPVYARYATLQEAKKRGVKTWLSLEPVLQAETALFFLRKEDNPVDLFRIGKLNYAPSTIDWTAFGREVERLCQEYGRDYCIKADLRREMEFERGICL